MLLVQLEIGFGFHRFLNRLETFLDAVLNIDPPVLERDQNDLLRPKGLFFAAGSGGENDSPWNVAGSKFISRYSKMESFE